MPASIVAVIVMPLERPKFSHASLIAFPSGSPSRIQRGRANLEMKQIAGVQEIQLTN